MASSAFHGIEGMNEGRGTGIIKLTNANPRSTGNG